MKSKDQLFLESAYKKVLKEHSADLPDFDEEEGDSENDFVTNLKFILSLAEAGDEEGAKNEIKELARTLGGSSSSHSEAPKTPKGPSLSDLSHPRHKPESFDFPKDENTGQGLN